jgi:PQQ-dependent catabolism-associated CXXCW motif protein
LCAALASGSVSTARATDDVPEPAGYRLDDFRSPTPATIAGGTALDTTGIEALLAAEPDLLLVDVVLPRHRPDNLPQTSLFIAKPRRDIPGSLWLPYFGSGELSPPLETFFRRTLSQVTGGDAARPIVFYCLADCWMSWNAAKRAIGWGYARVYWYRDGTDGWEAAGHPLADATPVTADGAAPGG